MYVDSSIISVTGVYKNMYCDDECWLLERNVYDVCMLYFTAIASILS